MFVIDDLLLSPVKGLLWVFRELHDAARRQVEGEAEALTQQLSTLYMQLETGQISPEQFDEAEAAILARLDEIDAAKGGSDEPEVADSDADIEADDEYEDEDDDEVEDDNDPDELEDAIDPVDTPLDDAAPRDRAPEDAR